MRSVALLALGVVLLFTQPRGQALASDESLPFFTSYSVTGNYVVGGVDVLPQASVDGFVTGTIHMSDVPPNADILAAFLYWETISTSGPAPGADAIGAKFRGRSIPVVNAVSKSSDLGSSVARCWGVGRSGEGLRLTTYRADVLQLLPPELDAKGNSTGKRQVNGNHTVALPDTGTGNTFPQSDGASLFVVYRDPDPAAKLTKVVVYDGLFVQTQGVAMSHKIRGFFDAAASPVAKMTHIVGSGAPNAYNQVYLNGSPLQGGDAFARAWSNPTFNFTSLPGLVSDNVYGDSVTTSVDHGGNNSPNDCLAWAAIIFSTTVQDTDGDGITDRAENADNADVEGPYGLKEPDGEKLPNLHDMGASATHRDIFIEIGAMRANAGTIYGSPAAPFSSTLQSVTDAVGHNHMPTPPALKMVGDAFAAAPADARYPLADAGIAVHFDVGPPANYFALFPTLSDADKNAANAYLVGNGIGDNVLALARGGESVVEQACAAPCQFPAYPGTVTWKMGFQLYRDKVFDHSRKDSFRYGWYAHASGIPKSVLPCLDSDGNPTTLNSSGACTTTAVNPSFHVPAGVGGRGDLPGADFIVTLGFFDNALFVGTDFVQASTTMHELGHDLDLWHGGAPPLSGPVDNSYQLNCKPNYLSVMNYVFQLGGLVDINGVPNLGYSGEVIENVDETTLTDGVPTLSGPYRTSWYAPRPPGDTRTPATRFCNGGKFADPPPTSMVRIDGTVGSQFDWNADGAFGFGLDASGTVPTGSQDVNFDGVPDSTLRGSNDWASLRLNQIGSRRNIAGFSLDSRLRSDGTLLLSDGTLLLSDGTLLLSDGALVLADGSTTLLLSDGTLLLSDGTLLLSDGSTLLADGTLLLSDGALVLADGTLLLSDGTLLLSDGALVLADGTLLLSDGSLVLADGSLVLADGSLLGQNIGELTPRIAAESGNIPGPVKLTACVIGEGLCTAPPPPSVPLPAITLHRTRLDWEAPTVGSVSEYSIYRVVGGTAPLTNPSSATATVPGTETSWVDPTELPDTIHFTYYVVANLVGGTESGRSNYRTIQAVNLAPVAVLDAFSTNEDTPLTGNVLDNDTDEDSVHTGLRAVLDTPPSHAKFFALNPDGSFTYIPTEDFESDPAPVDSFSYIANDGIWSGDSSVSMSPNSTAATVAIAVISRHTTTTITWPNSPIYGDALAFTATVAKVSPTVGGTLDGSATVQFKIDGTNFGSPVPVAAGIATSSSTSSLLAGDHSITAEYSGNIANRGTATVSGFYDSTGTATVTVAKRPATWTTQPSSKTYGELDPVPLTTGASAASPNNFVAADTIGATYSRATGETVAGGPYAITATLTDPYGKLGNYIVTNAGATFTINPRPATWTTTTNSKTYGDMDPNPLTTGSGSNFVAADGVSASYSRALGETVAGGPYHITATLGPAAVLGNYSITNAGADFTINKANAIIVVNPYSVTYDGNPHTATGSATGVEVPPANLTGLLHLGGTTHTAAGDYPTDPWTFDGNANYNAANGTVHDHIDQAAVTATAGSGSVPYDGFAKSPSACIVTGTYTGNLSCANDPALAGPDASMTVITPVVSGTGLGNFLITPVNGSYKISPAPSTTTFGAAPTPTYPGANFTVSASNNSGGTITYSYVSGPCALVSAIAGTFSPTGVGSCVVQANSATTANYLASSAQQTVTIAAPATLSVLWYTGGVGTFSVADYQAQITALANSASTTSPNRPWSVTFWSTGAVPSAPAGGWNVLVVASPVGYWSPYPDYSALNTALGNNSVHFDPTVNRVLVSGLDADWHYINGPGAVLDGPKGFLLNGINWAGSGSGMGLALLGWEPPSLGPAFDFSGFTPLCCGTDTVELPSPESGFPINNGLTSSGLSNWNTSAHDQFQFSGIDTSKWRGIGTAGSGVGANFVTIVSAPFASGGLTP